MDDDVRLGRRFRALRYRLGWRQGDPGEAAKVSQDTVSRTERGLIAGVSVPALRRQAAALGGELRIELLFRGGELDWLVDEGHAALVGAVVARLDSLGWETRPEVSFAVYGERGSSEVIAWHAASGTLLVIEVKTELVSIEETLRRHDVKVRLAAGVVAERFGWKARRVARLLVLPDGSTARAQVRRHDAVLRAALPVRGPALRAWLRAPSGSVSGLAFMPFTRGARGSRPPGSGSGVGRRGLSVPPDRPGARPTRVARARRGDHRAAARCTRLARRWHVGAVEGAEHAWGACAAGGPPGTLGLHAQGT